MGPVWKYEQFLRKVHLLSFIVNVGRHAENIQGWPVVCVMRDVVVMRAVEAGEDSAYNYDVFVNLDSQFDWKIHEKKRLSRC